MSRVGKKPIPIAKGASVEQQNGIIMVKGPKGELSVDVRHDLKVEVDEKEIRVLRANETKLQRSLHGLYRSLIQNMILGVTEGFQRKLEIVGVGYKAELRGKKLVLQLGYSHPILFSLPEGIQVEVPTPTAITVSGVDKQLVGQVAAKIKSLRPVEPYKGKGVKYEGEYVRRKAGKTAAAK